MRQAAAVLIFALMGIVFTAEPFRAFAGSTITGKVVYNGTSEEQEFPLSKWPNAQFCASTPKKALVRGDKRILPIIQVDGNKGLKATVVAITDIEDKAFMDGYKGTEVMAQFCEFEPFTGVVVKQKNLHVENHDNDENLDAATDVIYTAHLFEVLLSRTATVLNGGLVKGSRLDKPVAPRKVEQRSIFRLQCDMHAFMKSFFLPVMNPHYTVVRDDGTFEMKDVPAGMHTIMAWHPFVGEAWDVIEVTEGSNTQIEIEIIKSRHLTYSPY